MLTFFLVTFFVASLGALWASHVWAYVITKRALDNFYLWLWR